MTWKSALLVCRTGAADLGPVHGNRALPAAPDTDADHVYGELVIDRSRVLEFAAVAKIDHPLHLDVEHCASQGFNDLVVQGLELVDAIARAARMSTGRISTWFRRAVVAGESATLWCTPPDKWVVRTSTGDVAAIGRVETTAVGPP